jgi:hypothetical protein
MVVGSIHRVCPKITSPFSVGAQASVIFGIRNNINIDDAVPLQGMDLFSKTP